VETESRPISNHLATDQFL